MQTMYIHEHNFILFGAMFSTDNENKAYIMNYIANLFGEFPKYFNYHSGVFRERDNHFCELVEERTMEAIKNSLATKVQNEQAGLKYMFTYLKDEGNIRMGILRYIYENVDHKYKNKIHKHLVPIVLERLKTKLHKGIILETPDEIIGDIIEFIKNDQKVK